MTDYRKINSFKNIQDFRNYLSAEVINIGLVDEVPIDGSSALAQKTSCYGRTIGNRWAILPMEGWDCMPDGAPSEFTRRRWLRFAESGAKLIYGTEAAAVMHSGRSNPRQLVAADHTLDALKQLYQEMREVHKAKFGTDDDLMIGLQLTHSGRYSHPNNAHVREAKIAYSHPLLDIKFGNSAADVLSDEEVDDIIEHFIHAAEITQKAGFDFIDIKHAHGYLGHEFLTAYDRPGRYGGSFENRTRFFCKIADGIQEKCPGLHLSARISLFDILPFEKGDDGIGKAMEWNSPNAYPYAFGADESGMQMDPDLKDTVEFIRLLQKYGVELICATIGSPYYNVHMQRPAYFPVSDGYLMPENPLYNVSRHIQASKRIKELCPEISIVGSGLTCLQDYLPNAAEYSITNNEMDFAGIGRMVLSYPEICSDTLEGKQLRRNLICRTLGDCTNAPRAGMISGCYPLDSYYKQLPEALKLKSLKRR